MIDITYSSERAGTRKLIAGAAVVACILVVAAWSAFYWLPGSTDHSGEPVASSEVHPPAITVGNAVPAQSQATSNAAKQNPAVEQAAKQNPAVEEHASVGSASAMTAINKTSEPINITDAQRTALRSIFASGNPPRVAPPNFELMIGTSVAKQTPLAALPPEVPKVLNGFSGDQYVIAGNELVIVDQHSRRVAAIIGDVK